MIGDILQTAGNVLDTPGSILRGLLSGQHERAFSGILDPSQRVSGRDMLDKWGITDDNSGTLGDIGGFAAQVATDPLTWFGGSLARGLLGRGAAGAAEQAGAAGVKAAQAAQASKLAPELATAAKTADVGETLLGATSSLGGYEKLADGTIRRIQPTGGVPGGNTFGAGGTQTYARGARPMNDAEIWTGRPAGSLPASGSLEEQARRSLGGRMSFGGDNGITGSAGTSGNVADLLAKRRQFTTLKDVGTDLEGIPTSRAVGGTAALEPGQSAQNRAMQILDSEGGTHDLAAQYGSTVQGRYVPTDRTASIISGAGPEVARHENFHGLMDMARRSGDNSGLGLAGRISNAGQNSASPLLNELGIIGEEAAAHGAQARGGVGQLQNMISHLSNPMESYYNQYRDFSPRMAEIYGSSAIPRVALGAAGAGGMGLLAALGLTGRE